MKLKLNEKAILRDGSLILQVTKQNGKWGNKCVYTTGKYWKLNEFKPMDKQAAAVFSEEDFRKLSFNDYYNQIIL